MNPVQPPPIDRDRLLLLRAKCHLTQRELAALIGVTDRSIRNWERGFRAPRRTQVMLLAEALGTTRAYLYGEDEAAA